MIFIYLSIFLISIDGIITTNISKNSSLNRVIIISLCQADTIQLKSISTVSGRRHPYYFHSSSQSSSSLSSSSSSFLLSYCEHQQTTYYSSSGFSILHSSPRIPLTDIINKKSSSNVVLSTVDQSTSTNRNTITLMPSSSDKNPVFVDNDNNLTTTTTTTTILSNISLLHPSLSPIQNGNRTFNIMLLIGCITAGIILLILIYIIIKYFNRDEGSYKIDESINFATKSQLDDEHDNNLCTGKISISTHHRQKLTTTNERNLSDSKEWYV